jgi:hypothetical protein
LSLQHFQSSADGGASTLTDASWPQLAEPMMTQPTVRITPLEVGDSSVGGGGGSRDVDSSVGSFSFGGGFATGSGSMVPSFIGGRSLTHTFVGVSNCSALALPASVANGGGIGVGIGAVGLGVGGFGGFGGGDPIAPGYLGGSSLPPSFAGAAGSNLPNCSFASSNSMHRNEQSDTTVHGPMLAASSKRELTN